VPSADWFGYYDAQEGREPRELLTEVLRAFDAEHRVGSAVDIGCGDGTDSLALLARGWNVLSIDAEDDAIRRLRARLTDDVAARSTTDVSPMEGVDLPPADLVFASFSLPFCPPESFPDLWARIRASLRRGGRFAGELFGDRDTWASDPTMTFQDEDAARALFDGLVVESFVEEDEDGESFDGPKHWHVFHVIARRPGPG
jgi:trans-aconitate methyltransferase